MELDLARYIEDTVLFDFSKEGEATEEEVEEAYQRALDQLSNVEALLAMDQPEDELGCILEISWCWWYGKL